MNTIHDCSIDGTRRAREAAEAVAKLKHDPNKYTVEQVKEALEFVDKNQFIYESHEVWISSNQSIRIDEEKI